jgi:hypothetical protein
VSAVMWATRGKRERAVEMQSKRRMSEMRTRYANNTETWLHKGGQRKPRRRKSRDERSEDIKKGGNADLELVLEFACFALFCRENQRFAIQHREIVICRRIDLEKVMTCVSSAHIARVEN